MSFELSPKMDGLKRARILKCKFQCANSKVRIPNVCQIMINARVEKTCETCARTKLGWGVKRRRAFVTTSNELSLNCQVNLKVDLIPRAIILYSSYPLYPFRQSVDPSIHDPPSFPLFTLRFGEITKSQEQRLISLVPDHVACDDHCIFVESPRAAQTSNQKGGVGEEKGGDHAREEGHEDGAEQVVRDRALA